MKLNKGIGSCFKLFEVALSLYKILYDIKYIDFVFALANINFMFYEDWDLWILKN